MKILFQSLLLNALLLTAAAAATDGLQVSYTTEQSLATIGPDEDVVKMTFSVTKDGAPSDAQLHIVLDSPEVNSIISTDFPIVEGTRLFDARGITQGGKLEMSYLFPIRGQYTMRVSAQSLTTPALTTAETFTFSLNENPHEVINFYILISILVSIGLLSGVILAKSAIRQSNLSATA
ncbi:MAG: hypothetical protein L3J39_06725 [Verrucomicrobiales bacterium]|nr:hypothetical protein [Verrucomicrobiales bacterium]